MKRPLLFVLVCVLSLLVPAHVRAAVTFTIAIDKALNIPSASGRLIICIAAPDAKIARGTPVLDAPFWDDPQPLFGVELNDLKATDKPRVVSITDASSLGADELAPGTYRVGARLITTHQSSSWRDDAGNLYTDESTFTVPKPDAKDPNVKVALVLRHMTKAREWNSTSGAELVEIRSNLLSAFHGREVFLRAGVVKPIGFDEAKKYGAIYEVPGFGGDHFRAAETALRLKLTHEQWPEGRLARRAFHIVLNPESPNGHTLFADSDNNGPVGRALVTELIPAIEAKYPALIARPDARLLRGHSSGGWSVLWLALNYPDIFGKVWSSAPDPVDFRRFQLVDIYADANMYTRTAASAKGMGATCTPTDTPSFRKGDHALMTIREENAGERVLGPDQTSGQQWASWQAVFGPRVSEQGWGKGHPAALYDARSGVLDHAIAERFSAYDLGHLLRSHPEKYAPIWRDHIRLIVGDRDSFYLNEAVSLLKPDVESAIGKLATSPTPAWGCIKIVPGYDHGSLHASPEVQAIPTEMLEQLDALKP
jgi:hypothetical protein